MIYNLYQINGDGSKTLIQNFSTLADAQAAQTGAGPYSIEQWDGAFATVLI